MTFHDNLIFYLLYEASIIREVFTICQYTSYLILVLENELNGYICHVYLTLKVAFLLFSGAHRNNEMLLVIIILFYIT